MRISDWSSDVCSSDLSKEQKELKLLMKDEQRRWQVIGEQVRDIKARFGDKTPLGKRRTEIGDVPSEVVIPLEAVVAREPVTVLCSAKGWVRTLKGHQEAVSDAKYKEGDRSEERRVGKECVSTCRSRWSRYI